MSIVKKRSVVLAGRKTSISLEDQFWTALKEIAAKRAQRLGELINQIAASGESTNLSSNIRLFVLEHYCKRAQTTASVKQPDPG